MAKLNFTFIVSKLRTAGSFFLRMVNPMPEVGGLEISDLALRFMQINGKRTVIASLRLPPGIIEAGIVKDEANFILALKELHKKIAGGVSKRKFYVIAGLPSEIVYSQVFDIPLLRGTSLENAVQLNLEMISPLRRGESYSDSQQVGTREDGGFQLEYLGAFAEAEKVDRIERALYEAGFIAVAAEFPALSLARVMKELAAGIDLTKPIILLNASGAGINFIILRDGNLYFHYFIPWRQVALENHRITLPVLRELVQHHLQQVINFHTTRWGAHIADLVLVAPGVGDALRKTITENFSLKITDLSLKNFSNVPPDQFVSMGLALRGLIPRAKDGFISLLRIGTEEEFRLTQIMNFTKFWRNALIAVSVFLVLNFVAVDMLIVSVQRSVSGQNALLAITADVNELERLQKEAGEFNRLVTVAKATRGEEYQWSEFLGKLQSLATAHEITLVRVFFQSFEVPVLVNGLTNNEEAAIIFKNNLAKESNIQNVELPLTNLSTTASGVSFSLSFKLTK